MIIPDFSEFLDTLTEEKIESFGAQRNYVKIVADENGCIKLSSLSDIVQEITCHCEQTSLQYLRAYHEWLQNELKQK